ncbi:MAG: N-acetylmuramoyl-L-alanine amidase [Gammaproteobacteria bacterium]|nr:N-acetylmuramoyl-L-alanine amidase [Gammaproteobacteria bacterium]
MIAFWAIALPGSLHAAAVIEHARLVRDAGNFRLELDLSGAPTSYKVFTMQAPDRVVIDLDHAQLRASLRGIDLANSPVRNLRSGIRDGTGLRIVMDLAQRVSAQSAISAPTAGNPHRLVVNLQAPGSRMASTTRPVTTPSLAKAPTAPRPAPATTHSHPPAKLRNVVIAIDAGHGGEDPGAIGPARTHEKQVVLAISKALAALVNRETGYRAVLVRTGDYFIPLAKRPAIARRAGADIMVSVHADAFDNDTANGASVYALSQRGATSETAKYLADRENRADLIGGSVALNDKDPVLAGVILDLAMTATLNHSLQLGDQVLKSMAGVSRLHNHRVEQAGFVVLKSPDMPSILVETGFISNPGEARKLRDPAHQKRLASAIFTGVKRHFERHPPDGTRIAWEQRQRSSRSEQAAVSTTVPQPSIAQR